MSYWDHEVNILGHFWKCVNCEMMRLWMFYYWYYSIKNHIIVQSKSIGLWNYWKEFNFKELQEILKESNGSNEIILINFCS